MKQKNFTRFLAFCFCLVAIAALLLTGCVEQVNTTEAPKIESNQLGEGETAFSLTVIGTDGVEEEFEIRTDKKIVGEALLDVGLIAGEDSEYGLYIKTVNGETLDYETDGKYWAFYIDDAYAMTGVDSTEIDTAATYVLKAE